MQHTRLGGLKTLQQTVRHLLFDFYQYVLKLRDRRRRPVFLLVLKSLIFSVPLVFVPFSSHSYAETGAFVADLSFSNDIQIVSKQQAAITFNPGDSNTTIEFKHKQTEANERMRQRALRTGIPLRDLDSFELPGSLAQFLVTEHSPFAENVSDLLEASSEYNIDPRLLVGISGAESSFGLAMPAGSHNPFGLGPSRYFSSFREAFFAEAQFLHEHFTSRGIANPHAIGPSYTGTGSLTWGVSVAQIMTRI